MAAPQCTAANYQYLLIFINHFSGEGKVVDNFTAATVRHRADGEAEAKAEAEAWPGQGEPR